MWHWRICSTRLLATCRSELLMGLRCCKHLSSPKITVDQTWLANIARTRLKVSLFNPSSSTVPKEERRYGSLTKPSAPITLSWAFRHGWLTAALAKWVHRLQNERSCFSPTWALPPHRLLGKKTSPLESRSSLRFQHLTNHDSTTEPRGARVTAAKACENYGPGFSTAPFAEVTVMLHACLWTPNFTSPPIVFRKRFPYFFGIAIAISCLGCNPGSTP